MKGGSPANDFRMSVQPTATLGLEVLSLIERVEDPIGERLIGERPEPGSLLEFGRMRWQKEQMQSFGKLKLSALASSLPLWGRFTGRHQQAADLRHDPVPASATGYGRRVRSMALVALR